MRGTKGNLDQGPPPAYEDIETVPTAPIIPNLRDGYATASTRKYIRASRTSLPRSTRSPRSRSGSRAGTMTPAMRKEEPPLIKWFCPGLDLRFGELWKIDSDCALINFEWTMICGTENNDLKRTSWGLLVIRVRHGNKCCCLCCFSKHFVRILSIGFVFNSSFIGFRDFFYSGEYVQLNRIQ